MWEFMEREVIPNEEVFLSQINTDPEKRWKTYPPIIEELKQKAKAEGLWSLFMPAEALEKDGWGAGLSVREYAMLAEISGHSMIGAEVFNCNAPDSGNMELLYRYANDDQKRRWLVPLLNGDIRSCFAMTEPAVASSDARNISTSIQRQGDDYVINGRKWYISGAGDPRCRLCIVMGRQIPPESSSSSSSSSSSNKNAVASHVQHSMILVPMDTEGLKVVRPMGVFGFDDAPHGHMEVIFDNVRVPAKESLLFAEGRGFEMAQSRLGPGRIHHCMRLIGMAERALSLMCKRAISREAFGGTLASRHTIQQTIAHSRIDIDTARLLVLKAAQEIDEKGSKGARGLIAMIKVVAPQMAQRVIDRAIQVHGALGFSQDSPLPHLFIAARTLRIADGPDEVHERTVALLELSKHARNRL